MAKAGDPRRLRQAARPLLHRRLLERRPARARRRRAPGRRVRRLSSSATPAPCCRAPRSPTSSAGRPMRRSASNPADVSAPASRSPSASSSRAPCSHSCDALDGVRDGMVQDTNACQAAFDLERDVPTCSGARDGTCLSRGAEVGASPGSSPAHATRDGKPVYASFPYDAGHRDSRLGELEIQRAGDPRRRRRGRHLARCRRPIRRRFDGKRLHARQRRRRAAREGAGDRRDLHRIGALVHAAAAPRGHVGACASAARKIVIYHGTSDPIFSSEHSVAGLRGLERRQRLRRGELRAALPGARHEPLPRRPRRPISSTCSRRSSTGSSTARRRRGHASARGAGNAGGVNADVPPTWSATRTRPLCPYPAVARYSGSGDIETAASFVCR